MKKIINFIDNLSGLSGWLAGIMTVVALVLVVAEIIWRTGFSSTLYISDEFAGYLMAMLTFCGLAYTLRERGHIRMMMLPHFLKGRVRIIFNMVCFVIGFIFCIALTWFTYVFFLDSYVSGSKSMHVSETYLAIPQFSMPLGAALMTLQFLAEFLKGVAMLRGGTEGLRIHEETDELGR
ncbi:MAG: TRAP transporter small permease [Syntrophales bacterium]|jgi:TRAP-type C4-dicarboxylate transport system permease small subunit|nr:TRAP transporter small permease [Syntrophales bacterium]MCK9390912.1 TRAP transporter small permease [Syntrophales bacterium]